ncbi:MAG: TAXI family TRAP transporter solute-binding subunit, partial [Hyphomicrobiales bacterium]
MYSKLLLAAAVSVMAASGHSSPAESQTRLNMGSTSASSSYYSASVATAKIINSHVPEVSVTVVESGATYDNIKRTPHEFQMSIPSAYSGLVEAYYGTGKTFKDKPNDKIRIMFGFVPSSILFVVAKDSNVNGMSDLGSKGFYPGPTGNQTVAMSKKIMDLYK